jgi:hypothetical protein
MTFSPSSGVVVVDADRGAHVGEHLALQLAEELADDAREVGLAGDGGRAKR